MKTFCLLFVSVLLSDGAFPQWIMQNPLPTSNNLYSVCFPAESTGYAAGYLGTIVKTIDKGETWTKLHGDTTRFFWSVYFNDSLTGYAVGYDYENINGVISKTKDGGMTWSTLTPGTPGALLSVCFPDTNTGYM